MLIGYPTQKKCMAVSLNTNQILIPDEGLVWMPKRNPHKGQKNNEATCPQLGVYLAPLWQSPLFPC